MVCFRERIREGFRPYTYRTLSRHVLKFMEHLHTLISAVETSKIGPRFVSTDCSATVFGKFPGNV